MALPAQEPYVVLGMDMGTVNLAAAVVRTTITPGSLRWDAESVDGVELLYTGTKDCKRGPRMCDPVPPNKHTKQGLMEHHHTHMQIVRGTLWALDLARRHRPDFAVLEWNHIHNSGGGTAPEGVKLKAMALSIASILSAQGVDVAITMPSRWHGALQVAGVRVGGRGRQKDSSWDCCKRFFDKGPQDINDHEADSACLALVAIACPEKVAWYEHVPLAPSEPTKPADVIVID